MKFEYRIESYTIGSYNDYEMSQKLNAFGQEGWELCCCVVMTAVNTKMFYFKREIEETMRIKPLHTKINRRR